MAQKHIDITAKTDMDDIASASNAETLTNEVRIVYDTDTNLDTRVVAIQRAMEKMIEEG